MRNADEGRRFASICSVGLPAARSVSSEGLNLSSQLGPHHTLWILRLTIVELQIALRGDVIGSMGKRPSLQSLRLVMRWIARSIPSRQKRASGGAVAVCRTEDCHDAALQIRVPVFQDLRCLSDVFFAKGYVCHDLNR